MSDRVVRLLLHLYPPSLRREHGAELALTVSEAWRAETGLRSRARLVTHLLWDFLSSWLRASRPGPRRRRTPRASRRRFLPVLMGAIKSAVRLWSYSPMFALAAVVTLSLGIGTATAIFSLADAALLHPLPVPHVERVVQSKWSWSHADFRDLE